MMESVDDVARFEAIASLPACMMQIPTNDLMRQVTNTPWLERSQLKNCAATLE